MTDKQAADAIINAHGLKLSPPDKQVWFQRVEVAEMLSAAIAQPVQPTPQWTPTPKNINALPDAVRQYIHALSANCDPAGMVAENTLLKDCNLGLQIMYRKAVDSATAEPDGFYVCSRHDYDIVADPEQGCLKCNSERSQPVQPASTGFSSFLNSQEFYELMQTYRHTPLDAAKEFEAVIQALLIAIAKELKA